MLIAVHTGNEMIIITLIRAQLIMILHGNNKLSKSFISKKDHYTIFEGAVLTPQFRKGLLYDY